jgi:hypothetical protein
MHCPASKQDPLTLRIVDLPESPDPRSNTCTLASKGSGVNSKNKAELTLTCDDILAFAYRDRRGQHRSGLQGGIMRL